MEFTLRIAIVFSLVFLLSSCELFMWQYNPKPAQDIQRAEAKQANQPTLALADDGSFPKASGDVDPVMQKYQTFCASCHGAEGKGDGPGGVGMNARNFTDSEWKATYGKDSAGIKLILQLGVTGVKEKDPQKYARLNNAAMVGWSALLNDEELDKMVEIVQSFE